MSNFHNTRNVFNHSMPDTDAVCRYLREFNNKKNNDQSELMLSLGHYKNLRMRFSNMVSHILGVDYYNDSYDVVECDNRCCNAVVTKFDDLQLKYKFWKGVGRASLAVGIMLLFMLILTHSI